MGNEYKISFENTGDKRPLGKTRGKWNVNIKIDLKDRVCGIGSSVSGQGIKFPFP